MKATIFSYHLPKTWVHLMSHLIIKTWKANFDAGPSLLLYVIVLCAVNQPFNRKYWKWSYIKVYIKSHIMKTLSLKSILYFGNVAIRYINEETCVHSKFSYSTILLVFFWACFSWDTQYILHYRTYWSYWKQNKNKTKTKTKAKTKQNKTKTNSTSYRKDNHLGISITHHFKNIQLSWKIRFSHSFA